MPFIEKRFLSRANWRNMNRRTHSDDETAESLIIGTNDCWKMGSCIPGVPSTTEPTLSEFFALNQFTEPFTKVVAKYNGPQKSACGFISIANALVLCEEINKRNLWDRSMNGNELQELLDAVCTPEKVMPKVENALHYIATLRVDYIKNHPNASASLKSSPKQQNLFLSAWAAPFEISDCVREIFKKLSGSQGQQQQQLSMISQQKAVQKQSPFGPSPHPLPNSNIFINDNSVSNLMFMRTNLYPIRHTAKELQALRIEQEDKQFGGVSATPNRQSGVITYRSGDAAFFVDLLASDFVGECRDEKKKKKASRQEGNSGVADDSPVKEDAQPENTRQNDNTSNNHPPKFVSPRNVLINMQNPSSSLFPPPRGCRVYIIDVIGHFCVLLCYLDASGTPHGVVVNSASGDLSDMHRKPTVRVAFDLYVSNATDGFRGDFSVENRKQTQNNNHDDDEDDSVTRRKEVPDEKKQESSSGKGGESKDDAINVDDD